MREKGEEQPALRFQRGDGSLITLDLEGRVLGNGACPRFLREAGGRDLAA